MDGSPPRSAALRGLCCTALALGVHGAFAIALPVAASTHREEAKVEMVWLADAPAPVASPRARLRDMAAAAGLPATSSAVASPELRSASKTKTGRNLRRPARARPTPAPGADVPASQTPDRAEVASHELAAAAIAKGEGETGASAAAEGEGDASPEHAGPGLEGGATGGQAGQAATAPKLQPLYGSPCHLYFPAGAKSDEGEVVVRTQVDATGGVERVEVVQERPAAQGFGRAAQVCARRLRFAPARDANDVAVPGAATLQLRFARD